MIESVNRSSVTGRLHMIVCLSLLSLETASAGPPVSPTRNHWTIGFYGACDDSSERYVLRQIADIKNHLVADQGLRVVLLLDRSPKYSDDAEVLGEDFADTRLYEISPKSARRISGAAEFPEITVSSEHEANMGDGMTLKKFIRFLKAQHPADQYALILYGHGVGRCLCFDETNHGDSLFAAELTDSLTVAESVDLLVLDSCSMAAVENIYQWRPTAKEGFHADILVTAAVVGSPLPYDRVFARLGRLATDPSPTPTDEARGTDLSATAFGTMLVQEADAYLQELHSRDPSIDYESWGCYDLSAAEPLKGAVDRLAMALARTDARRAVEEIRGSGDTSRTMHYMLRLEENAWLYTPYFDLYDLASRLADTTAVPGAVQAAAHGVMDAVDAVVVDSVGQKRYDGFVRGKHGLHITFPDGSAMHDGKRHWAYCRWYAPGDARHVDKNSYGFYRWCRDGATQGNGVVENWFELLDSWYDTTNDASGGLNGYRW